MPHKGGAESITGLLGQQVDFLFESPVVLLPLIRDGKLRALGVTSATRRSEHPDVPTMVEAGVPGFVATLLTGIVAPAGTPAAIVGKLNGVINETLKAADVVELLTRFGSTGTHRLAAGFRDLPRGRDPQMGRYRQGGERVGQIDVTSQWPACAAIVCPKAWMPTSAGDG